MIIIHADNQDASFGEREPRCCNLLLEFFRLASPHSRDSFGLLELSKLINFSGFVCSNMKGQGNSNNLFRVSRSGT